MINRYIALIQRDNLEDEESREKESISDFIGQRFTNDIGNFLLLRDSDNISASNRPLAEKIPQYYNNVDDFTSIYPNRYLTPGDGPVDQELLDRLRAQYTEVQNDKRTEIDRGVLDYFNSIWTYEAMKSRRVELLVDILDVLEFESTEDEFGLETDREAVLDEVQNKTDIEFEKRLSVRSL